MHTDVRESVTVIEPVASKKVTSSLIRYQSHKGHRIDIQCDRRTVKVGWPLEIAVRYLVFFFLFYPLFTFGGCITDCIDFYAPVLQINEIQTRN